MLHACIGGEGVKKGQKTACALLECPLQFYSNFIIVSKSSSHKTKADAFDEMFYSPITKLLKCVKVKVVNFPGTPFGDFLQ